MDEKNPDTIEELHTSPTLRPYSQPEIPVVEKNKPSFPNKKGIFLILLFVACLGATGFIVLQKTIFHHSSSPITNIIGPCPDFVGRVDYLSKLHKAFLTPSNSNSLKIRGLWGKGGFGKSEIAIQFAHLNHSRFSIIWSFCCDSPEQLNQGYRDLAKRLQILVSSDSAEKTRQKVHYYLENRQLGLPWLLIYDNMESDFTDYPKKGGAIIVTSQKKVLASELLIEVSPFSEQEGLELLQKITQEKHKEVMQQLVKDFEGIPLLINYAAHYVKATPGCTVKEYHNLFSTHVLEKEGPIWAEMDENRRYKKSLAASWQRSIESLGQESLHAAQWLAICSYLHPEQIPTEWLSEWVSQHNIDCQPEKILKSLQNYGLIRYEEKTHTFSIHRFFQLIVREHRKKFLNEDLGDALILLAKYANEYDFTNMSTWGKGKIWYLHASVLRKWVETTPLARSYDSFQVKIYENIGSWCINTEDYQEALDASYNALTLINNITHYNYTDVCLIYNHISKSLFKLGRYDEGLDFCKKSKELLESYSAEKSLDFARVLSTEAGILYEQGWYEIAVESRKKILDIQLKHYGEIHVEVGRNLHGLGLCLAELGKYDEIIIIRKQIGKIFQKTCGEQHPLFGFNLNAQGWIFYKKKEYNKALKHFSQALSIFKKSEGPQHGDTCFPLIGIGFSHLRLNKYKKAHQTFKTALGIGLQHYGKNNRMVIEAYEGIGWTYLKSGQSIKGLKYLLKQLVIGQEVFKDSPTMSKMLKDYLEALEEALQQEGITEALLQAVEKGYQVCENMFGKDYSVSQSFRAFIERSICNDGSHLSVQRS